MSVEHDVLNIVEILVLSEVETQIQAPFAAPVG